MAEDPTFEHSYEVEVVSAWTYLTDEHMIPLVGTGLAQLVLVRTAGAGTEAVTRYVYPLEPVCWHLADIHHAVAGLVVVGINPVDTILQHRFPKGALPADSRMLVSYVPPEPKDAHP